MDDLKNQEVEQQEHSNNEEKTFTQDDVNRIVEKRLKREKEKNSNDSIDIFEEKERNLDKRELNLDCREKLAENGLSPDFIKFFRGKSKEDLDDFVNEVRNLTENLNNEFESKSGGRFNSHVPPNNTSSDFDPVREAFKYPGLK